MSVDHGHMPSLGFLLLLLTSCKMFQWIPENDGMSSQAGTSQGNPAESVMSNRFHFHRQAGLSELIWASIQRLEDDSYQNPSRTWVSVNETTSEHADGDGEEMRCWPPTEMTRVTAWAQSWENQKRKTMYIQSKPSFACSCQFQQCLVKTLEAKILAVTL